MSGNPFIVPHSQLPATIPVFPLSGAILMPGNELPLNIFEPRYLNMVNDVLATHRMIGMTQPDPAAGDDKTLCRTGCAGRITQYRETSDGRIETVLSGVCRYDIDEELTTTRGYRLIVPNWSRFEADYEDYPDIPEAQNELVVSHLKRYFDYRKLEVDWPLLERLTTPKLVDSLTMALPLGPRDKQALLETLGVSERIGLFVALLDNEPGLHESDTRH